MEYFKNFPRIEYSNNSVVNILARNKIKDDLLNNVYVYYPYTVRDSDRPDILATAYYGNSKYTWLIFYANNIIDPIREWVLSDRDFNKYLNFKYREENFSRPWNSGTEYKENDTVYVSSGVYKDMVFICKQDHISSVTFDLDFGNTDSVEIVDPADPRYGGDSVGGPLSYGAGAVSVQQNNSGTGYKIGDLLTADQTGTRSSAATVEVSSVDENGAITNIRLVSPGSFHAIGEVVAFGGSGTNARFNITSQRTSSIKIENENNKWLLLSENKREGFRIANQTIHEYRNAKNLIVDFESWYSDVVTEMNDPANFPSNWQWSEYNSNSQVVRVINEADVITNITAKKYFVPTNGGGFWSATFSKSRLAVNLTKKFNPNQIAFTANLSGSKRPISKFTFENDLNENRRSIKLIDKIYAAQILQEFKALFNKKA